MSFDRKTFFDAIRPYPFPDSLSQEQVDGMEGILTTWETMQGSGHDTRHLAYMMATTFHETAQTMQPIEEYGKGSGHDYGKPDPETGQTYYGRGFVQLTWKENYQRATDKLLLVGTDDLVWHPEMALDLQIATWVLFEGMGDGWFTGKKLSDYFSATVDDPYNARRIVNGTDQATAISEYHGAFLDALEMAEMVVEMPEPEEPFKPWPLEKHIVVNVTAPEGVSFELWVNGVRSV